MNTDCCSDTRMVAVLTAAIATIGANSLALGPIAPSIAADLSAGITATMTAAGSYGLCTALGALALSGLIDRLGVQRALSWSLGALTVAFAASALAPSIGGLVLAQGAAGFAAGLGLPAIYAYAAQIAPKGRESTILGRVLVGWTLSMVAGVSLSSLIADLVHWRAVYAMLAAFAAAACLCVVLARRGENPRRASTPLSPIAVLRIDGVAPLLIICFAYMTAFYGTYAYIGDHLHTALGLPVRASGLIVIAYGIGFGAAVFGDPYIDRFSARRTLPLSILAIALTYAGIGLGAGAYGGLIALGLLWGLVNHFGLNLIVAGLSATDPDKRGAILGMNSAVTYVAASVGALVFGPLYEALGFAALAYIAAGVTAAAAALALARTRSLDLEAAR